MPFRRWSLDFVGPLPETRSGSKWILVAIDNCTKWPVARACARADVKTVAQFLYDEILMNFGCPDEILTDRGAQFMAQVLELYMENQKIHHLKTSAYHPRTNGLVERLNGFIQKMITKYTYENPTRWDEYLTQALFACRVRTHSSTRNSPFKLLYGVDPKLPGDSTRPFMYDESDQEDLLEYRMKELEALGQTRAAAITLAKLNALRMKKRYDINIKDLNYQIGNTVWIKKGNTTKFETKYEGPYRILNVCPYGTFQLIRPNGDIKNDLVHKDRLKPATLDEREEKTFH